MAGWYFGSLQSSTIAVERTGESDNGPWMDPLELAMMRMILGPETTMIEFGSGRSTAYFSQFTKKYVAIEASKMWCRAVHADLVRSGLGHVEVRCVEPDVSLNSPEGQATPNGEQFLTYSQGIMGDCCQTVQSPLSADVILIDGQVRLEIARIIHDRVSPHTFVVIHDYIRDYYHPAEELYDVVMQSTQSAQPGGGQIAIMRKKHPAGAANAALDNVLGVGDYGTEPRDEGLLGGLLVDAAARAQQAAMDPIETGSEEPLQKGHTTVLVGDRDPSFSPAKHWNLESVAASVRCTSNRKDGRPWMRPIDVALVRSFIHYDGNMVQIGAGNHTLYFAQLVKHMVVVETDPVVCDWVKQHIESRGYDHVQLLCAETRVSEAAAFAFVKLALSSPECCDFVDPVRTDIMLLTGPARVEIAKYYGFHTSAPTVIAVHDYAREDYKVLASSLKEMSRTTGGGPWEDDGTDGGAGGIGVFSPANYEHKAAMHKFHLGLPAPEEAAELADEYVTPTCRQL